MIIFSITLVSLFNICHMMNGLWHLWKNRSDIGRWQAGITFHCHVISNIQRMNLILGLLQIGACAIVPMSDVKVGLWFPILAILFANIALAKFTTNTEKAVVRRALDEGRTFDVPFQTLRRYPINFLRS